MVETGLEAYHFSISWSRLIPNGRSPINPRGLEYYNDLINKLVAHGIEPHVHFDEPQAPKDEYGGWRSPNMMQKGFQSYADVCFREFGDRVMHWSTMNDTKMFVLLGYDTNMVSLPPGRCSPLFGCPNGNSSTEPYFVMHDIRTRIECEIVPRDLPGSNELPIGVIRN